VVAGAPPKTTIETVNQDNLHQELTKNPQRYSEENGRANGAKEKRRGLSAVNRRSRTTTKGGRKKGSEAVTVPRNQTGATGSCNQGSGRFDNGEQETVGKKETDPTDEKKTRSATQRRNE